MRLNRRSQFGLGSTSTGVGWTRADAGPDTPGREHGKEKNVFYSPLSDPSRSKEEREEVFSEDGSTFRHLI